MFAGETSFQRGERGEVNEFSMDRTARASLWVFFSVFLHIVDFRCSMSSMFSEMANWVKCLRCKKKCFCVFLVVLIKASLFLMVFIKPN